MRKVNRDSYKSKVDYAYHILGLFFIYAVLGFFAESIFRNFIKGRSGKAGFLIYSPVLPIYGFMGVITYIFARPLENMIESQKKKNNNEILVALLIYLLFFAISSSFLEVSGGVILEYIYETREWNYSGHILNFMGYISLKFTLMFSIVGTAHMYILFYPADKVLSKHSQNNIVRIVLSLITVICFIDFVYTTVISVM